MSAHQGLSRFWTTESALVRYRIMAMTVGTGLAILCFVGIPLQVAGNSIVVEIVGTLHGFLYIIYLITSLDLAARARFRTVQLLGMVGAGLLPGLAFYMEHKVTQRVKAQIALGDAAPPGPAATVWAALARRPASNRSTAAGADASAAYRGTPDARGQQGAEVAVEPAPPGS
ncbi:MAG TPA: DUF3817 domain-containing protein [Acidimicrobiales bacterium]|nr:DUF3817 domain-containing protein [Acidimicrobiales bacterium]